MKDTGELANFTTGICAWKNDIYFRNVLKIVGNCDFCIAPYCARSSFAQRGWPHLIWPCHPIPRLAPFDLCRDLGWETSLKDESASSWRLWPKVPVSWDSCTYEHLWVSEIKTNGKNIGFRSALISCVSKLSQEIQETCRQDMRFVQGKL